MSQLRRIDKLNQQEKLDLIETSMREWRNPTTIAPALPAKQLQELTQLEYEMRASRNQLIKAAEASKRQTESYNQAMNQLRTRIRHAYQLVKRKVGDPSYPESLIMAFGLKADGTYPKANAHLPMPIQCAKDILQAEAAAAAQGKGILTDPSPGEIAQLIEEAEQQESQRSTALAELEQGQSRVKAANQQFNHLYKSLLHYLRFALTGEPRENFQKVLRALGFQYQSKKPNQPSETADPETNLQPQTIAVPQRNNQAVVAGLSTGHRPQSIAKPNRTGDPSVRPGPQVPAILISQPSSDRRHTTPPQKNDDKAGSINTNRRPQSIAKPNRTGDPSDRPGPQVPAILIAQPSSDQRNTTPPQQMSCQPFQGHQTCTTQTPNDNDLTVVLLQ